MARIVKNGINFSRTDTSIELTQAEYDALPDTKYHDDINYFITDGIGASSVKSIKHTITEESDIIDVHSSTVDDPTLITSLTLPAGLYFINTSLRYQELPSDTQLENHIFLSDDMDNPISSVILTVNSGANWFQNHAMVNLTKELTVNLCARQANAMSDTDKTGENGITLSCTGIIIATKVL